MEVVKEMLIVSGLLKIVKEHATHTLILMVKTTYNKAEFVFIN